MHIASTPQLDTNAYKSAEIFITYYPYNDNPDKNNLINGSDFMPYVRHPSWHDELMDNELTSIKALGITGIVVCLEPEDLADEDKQASIGIFLNKCSENGVFVILCLAPADETLFKLRNVSAFLNSQEWSESPAFYRENGKILFALAPEAQFEDEMCLPYQCIWLFLKPGYEEASAALPSPFSIVKSINSVESFQADRKNGKALIENLNSALQTNKKIIIQSWNCYRDGTAIEKNSFDYDTLMQAVLKDLQTEKEK